MSDELTSQRELINSSISLDMFNDDFNDSIVTSNKYNTIIKQHGMTDGLAHVLQHTTNIQIVGSENLSKIYSSIKKAIIVFFDKLMDFCKKLFKWIRDKFNTDSSDITVIKNNMLKLDSSIDTLAITAVDETISVNQLKQWSTLYTKVYTSNRVTILPNNDTMNSIETTLTDVIGLVHYEFTKSVLENDISWAIAFEEKFRNNDNASILAHREFNNRFYNRYRTFHDGILPKLQFLGIGCSRFPTAGRMPYDNASWVTYTNSEINKHLKTNTLAGHGYVVTDRNYYKANDKFKTLPIPLPDRYDCINAISTMEVHMKNIRQSLDTFDYIDNAIGDTKAKFSYQMHSAVYPELYEQEPASGVLVDVWREVLNNLFTLRQLTDTIIGYIGRISGLIRVAAQVCYKAHEIRHQFESMCIKYQLQTGGLK